MKHLIVLGVILLAFAGCSKSSTPTDTGTVAPAASAMPAATTAMATAGAMAMHMKGQSMTITMNAQNGSGESGTATLTAMGANKTRVVIGITGEKTTGDQPAHIHPGSCAKLNPIPKYPLKDVILGKSNTVVDVAWKTVTDGHWAINVHESAANLKRYVSCGDIKAGAM